MILACGIALLMVPRGWVLLPCLIMASTVTPTQRVVIASLDFSLLRIIVLFGITRIFLKTEYKSIRWGKLDTLMFMWALSGIMIYTIQWGSFTAFVNRVGWAVESLGLYFLFRATIRTWDDIVNVGRMIAIVAIPIALFFLLEKFTQKNIFSVFGGVPETTLVRDGRVRCQGAYSHPIIAGAFWASLLPLAAVVGWADPKWRKAAVVGSVCCILIAFLTTSSTSLAGVGAAFLGAGLWKLRKRMGFLQISVICGLVTLHMVMRTPVWHLISRIDLAGGSTGYHRYKVIDSAIKYFSEWAVCGVKTTAHWGYGMQDVTVYYVLQAVRGGMLTLVLFVSIILVAFGCVGRAMAIVLPGSQKEKLVWAVGVSFGVHVANFFGVSYFGQATMAWNLSLALTMSALAAAIDSRRRPECPETVLSASKIKCLNRANRRPATLSSIT